MATISNGPLREALTFDDVLIQPGLSELLPADVDIRSRITREIPLNIPIVASAMDTVTEAEMAIAMAQAGGLGVIHRNMEPDEQAAQVRQVKKFESGMVVNPLTIQPGATLADALELMKAHRISGVPVVEGGGNGKAGKLVGILTNRDVRFATDTAPDGRGADDQGQADHRPRGRRPGRGQAPAAPAPHREASGRRRPVPLRRPDHGEGHGEGGHQSRMPARTSRAACASPPPPRSATRATSAPSG